MSLARVAPAVFATFESPGSLGVYGTRAGLGETGLRLVTFATEKLLIV